MEIMNAVTERNNPINYEIQEPDYWNISSTRHNQILSRRKLARFVASLICQTNEIENKLKIIAEQKYISVNEERNIKKICELYEQMSFLLKEWKNLHFKNSSDREFTVNSWSRQSFESPNQNRKLII